MTATEDFGTFTKDDETRVAYSRGDAVKYLFEGWREVKADDAAPSVDSPVIDRADSPPPKGGPGSGRDAWLAYASSHGVPVHDDASRDEVVAALDGAGVPTE